ncbi:ankyrin repeat domain-containing protein [Jatrophihabitans fulvus]
MPRSLPERPNPEQLRKQARELQRGVRAGDPQALRLAGLDQPDPDHPLHRAQLALARSYGFGSWPRLAAHVATLAARTWTCPPAGADEPVAHRFLRLTSCTWSDDAGPDVDAARALLATHGDALSLELSSAAVAGDVASVRRLLAGNARADDAGGPFGWTALMYVSYSRLDVGEAATLEVVRTLLAAGADPDEGRYFDGWPTPFTVLTGAFGDGEGQQPPHPHSPALARVLLEAGAEPNDAQTLYNRQFGEGDDWLELLFGFGLGTGDGGPWRRRLPDLADSPEVMVRKLLEWAAAHDQRARVERLGRHGVDLVAPLPSSGRAPYALALANGHRALADLLPAVDVDPVEALIGAALAGDGAAVDAAAPDVLAAARVARPGLVAWAASLGRPSAVELLVRAGWDVDALGRGDAPIEQPWQTGLHTAVEQDDAATVATLLALGARTDVRDARFDATARDWAVHLGRPDLLPLLEEDGPPAG